MDEPEYTGKLFTLIKGCAGYGYYQTSLKKAFDKKARGAMHTKREGKAQQRPRFGTQFAQALIDY